MPVPAPSGSPRRFLSSAPIGAIVVVVMLSACDTHSNRVAATPDEAVFRALAEIGLDDTALAVPKLGGLSVSPAARLPIVDRLMANPLEMRPLTARLLEPRTGGGGAEFLAGRIEALGIMPASATFAPADEDPVAGAPVTPLLAVATSVAKAHREALALSPNQWRELSRDLADLIAYQGEEQEQRWITRKSFHAISHKPEPGDIAEHLLALVRALEALVTSDSALDQWKPREWRTPLGRVRIGTRGADRYEGEYFAILDPGGDDTFVDVHAPLQVGAVLLVRDVAGNDDVSWSEYAGPGTGLFGFSVWMDDAGDDTYQGGNVGAGAAIHGAGLLWDRQGNDRYEGGSQVQGVANYGIGVLWDEQGDDQYQAGMSAQGFGGPGGIGMLIDASGDDRYHCGGLAPDRMEARIARHAGIRYVTMCQGYGFGFRPDISGGLGVLLDHGGNDSYEADIFGQGGGFWFAAGILGDLAGDDRYRALEHCQGSSVHLSAGFLGDWAGNDRYEGFEHCQGVGVDRGAGFLYDEQGDDSYAATRDAQGTGLKTYGVGLLWDRAGGDRYDAKESSQGYSALVDPLPENEWPVGLLIDEGAGDDAFELTNVKPPGRRPRIQNRQGITVAR